MTGSPGLDVDQTVTPQKRPWGIRFSLLSMILLITIVALAISNWQKSKQLTQMKQRNEQLAQALGIPSITDPTKVTAIGVPTIVNNGWEWHLVIPQGKEYDLYVAFTHIPQEGLPENPIHVESLTDGEVRIHLSFEYHETLPPSVMVRGRYVVPAQGAKTLLYHDLSEHEASWMFHYGGEYREVARKEDSKLHRTSSQGLIGDPEYVTTLFDPDDVIVLRRTRVFPIDSPTDHQQPKTCAGMMVWLVPKVAEDQAEDR